MCITWHSGHTNRSIKKCRSLVLLRVLCVLVSTLRRCRTRCPMRPQPTVPTTLPSRSYALRNNTQAYT